MSVYEPVQRQFFYFGVWEAGKAGHHLYPVGFTTSFRGEVLFLGRKLDQGFCPAGAQAQGAVKLWHKAGFTVASWWDRTGDSRYGSHATFGVNGTYTFAEMMDFIQRKYPHIIARQPIQPFLHEFVEEP